MQASMSSLVEHANLSKLWKGICQTIQRGFSTGGSGTRCSIASFLLKDVAGVRDLNQPDGIHPTAKGHKLWRKPFMIFFVLGDLNGQSRINNP